MPITLSMCVFDKVIVAIDQVSNCRLMQTSPAGTEKQGRCWSQEGDAHE